MEGFITQEDEKKLYFRGRCLRIPLEKRKILYEETIKILKEHTIIIFLDEIRKFLLEESENKKINLPSSMYWIDACIFFLYWLHTYYSFRKYEIMFGIPHSTSCNVVHFFQKLVIKKFVLL